MRQRWGVMFQHGGLFGSLTVTENIGLPLREHTKLDDSLIDQIAAWKLALTGLAPEVGAQYPSELSGGMMKRASLARALALDPELLFLDEPTAGLDPQSRIALWEILGDLHDDGQTILLTTHYMEEADEFCDRVAVMDHGHILALDTPAQLKASIGAGRIVIVSATGDLPALADALVAGVDGAHQARVVEGRIHLSVDASEGLLPRIIDAAEAAGSSVNDLSVTEPTLESVFINLTGKDLRE
jgi:ABC-2 type transport system ATP-binding protein